MVVWQGEDVLKSSQMFRSKVPFPILMYRLLHVVYAGKPAEERFRHDFSPGCRLIQDHAAWPLGSGAYYLLEGSTMRSVSPNAVGGFSFQR